MDGLSIKKRLRAEGLRQADLADWLDLDISIVSRLLNNQRRIQVGEAARIDAFFEQRAPELGERGSNDQEGFAFKDASHARPQPYGDVPLYSAGGDQVLRLDARGRAGSTAAHPGQIGARGGFAAYVVNDDMAPRYAQGELVYAISGKPPRRDQGCIVEFADGTAILATYCAASPSAVTVRLMSEKADRAIPRDRIAGIHGVIGTG